MADTNNGLIAAVADSIVGLVATRSQAAGNLMVQSSTFNGRDEPMGRVMAVLVLGEARLA